MMERATRLGVFTLCLLPFLWMIISAARGALGPDPAEVVMHITGEWSLRTLAFCLLMSPLRAWTNWAVLLKLRRMLGLYAFFYACVHFLAFLQLFVGWNADILLEELTERPYITVGFGAWLLMLPLAMTSTRAMQRRLRKNWLRLHRLVYPAAVLACLHLLWQARSDIGESIIYLLFFAALLGWRLRRRILSRRPSAPA